MKKTKFKSSHGAGSLGATKMRKGGTMGTDIPKMKPKPASSGMPKMGRKKRGLT